jgi:DNA-binding transcriptional LysR family regulator
VAVADHNNLSEAALQLDLSQSAISHAIANLEDELGVLEKETKEVIKTDWV